jgi:hypothetical protein
MNRFFQKGFLTASAISVFGLCSASAQPSEQMVGLANFGVGPLSVIKFMSDDPSTITEVHPIFGLRANETLFGLDFDAGVYYGVGSFGALYSVDPNSGAATLFGDGFNPPTPLNGSAFGVDNTPGGLRIVSNLEQNLLVDRVTGELISSGPAYSPGSLFLSGLAYDVGSGDIFAIDTGANELGIVDPTTGGYASVGLLGIDASRVNGLDSSLATGFLYLASPAASGDPQADLYVINKTTGVATLVGQIGLPGDDVILVGLTTVPEPGAASLFVLGGLALWVVGFRNRRQ